MSPVPGSAVGRACPWVRRLPGAGLLLLAGLAMPGVCRAQGVAEPSPPYQTFTMASRATGDERRLNVYLPPGYGWEPTAFPVLYMPDGGVGEDFPHVATTVDSLIRLGVIRPFLVVGIENTERRRDMTGPTTIGSDSAIAPRVGGSAAFRDFIRDELMPEVQRRFRVTDETAVVGESLAGLFLVECFLFEPTLFDHVIALSPSLWWNGGAMVEGAAARISALDRSPRTLYLSSADEDSIVPRVAALAGLLRDRAPASLTWYHVPRPDLTHRTIYRGVAAAAFAKVLR